MLNIQLSTFNFQRSNFQHSPFNFFQQSPCNTHLSTTLNPPLKFISIKVHYRGGGLEGEAPRTLSESLEFLGFWRGPAGALCEIGCTGASGGHVGFSMDLAGLIFRKPVPISLQKNRYGKRKNHEKPIVCSRENLIP